MRTLPLLSACENLVYRTFSSTFVWVCTRSHSYKYLRLCDLRLFERMGVCLVTLKSWWRTDWSLFISVLRKSVCVRVCLAVTVEHLLLLKAVVWHGLTHIVGLCYELFYVCPRADGVSAAETSAIETSTQQALHYALAGAAQQVQIHRIGEDGQVQVVSIVISSSKSNPHKYI